MVTLDEKVERAFCDPDQTEEDVRNYFAVMLAQGIVLGGADGEEFVEELEEHISDFEDADVEDVYSMAREKMGVV